MSGPCQVCQTAKEWQMKALVVLVGALLALVMAPASHAGPGGSIAMPGVCDYPGIGGSTYSAGAFSYYCDFPVEENGAHWHSELGGYNIGGPTGASSLGGEFMGFGVTIPAGSFGGGTGGSGWRWPDNTPAPAPNPPGAWKNYMVPKLAPPEHRGPPAPPMRHR